MHILAQQSFLTIAMLLVGLVILIMFVTIMFQLVVLYIRACISGACVSFKDLVGMKLRKLDALTIVNSRIQALHAGLPVTTPQMESHMLAGGDVDRVIRAMIAANKANIDLSWKTATAIDLAGRDILEAVLTSVNPKGIDVPSP